ncbi:hypothetical protein [Undibacterium sp. Tian12W]|uniref:hypothetical protein n=1 Tax=Undibacterium sp. Tian12W TaxID=3413054 RepID=UPI003BF251CF
MKLLLLVEIEVSNRPPYRSNLEESPGRAGGLPYLFKDLKKSCIHWAEDELRSRDELMLYFLDFEKLPWTAAILAAPRNHVLSSAPRSSYEAAEVAVDIGLQQSSWTQSFFIDKETRIKFKKELSSHDLTERNIPYGLLPFDGGLLNPPHTGFNKKERPLIPLWFRTYLLPKTPEARENLTRVLHQYVAERGIFFVRPFDDEALASTDWQSRFLGCDEHEEAILFWNLYEGSESAQKEHIQLERLENVLAELEKGASIDFTSMSPNFDDFSFQISYPYAAVNYLKDYDAMNRGQRNIDLVNALRAHLIRRLEWPVFIHSALVCRERAIERFKRGPKPPSGLLKFNAIEEIDLFLEAMKKKYPSYWQSSWDDVWRT